VILRRALGNGFEVGREADRWRREGYKWLSEAEVYAEHTPNPDKSVIDDMVSKGNLMILQSDAAEEIYRKSVFYGNC